MGISQHRRKTLKTRITACLETLDLTACLYFHTSHVVSHATSCYVFQATTHINHHTWTHPSTTAPPSRRSHCRAIGKHFRLQFCCLTVYELLLYKSRFCKATHYTTWEQVGQIMSQGPRNTVEATLMLICRLYRENNVQHFPHSWLSTHYDGESRWWKWS